MNPDDFLTVSTYQGPIHEGEFDKNFQKTLDVLNYTNEIKSDFLLMPECFWHGYFDTKEKALKNAIDLKSIEFKDILEQLKRFATTLIVGAIVRENKKVYNTALIIREGELIGRYNKATSYSPYDFIEHGREFPLFEHKGIEYGVIICFDSTSFEPSRILALKGAKIIFCPLFNRMKRQSDMPSLLHHMSHQIARSAENSCWFVTSDIIWNTDDEVCQGHTCIFDNDGRIVSKSQPFEENVISYTIPLTSLKREKEKRLKGHNNLFDQMVEVYNKKYK